MRVTRSMIEEAVAAGVLGRAAGSRTVGLPRSKANRKRLSWPAHILYYLGGLIAIGAMTLFMTLGWERFGGGGLVCDLLGLLRCGSRPYRVLLSSRSLCNPRRYYCSTRRRHGSIGSLRGSAFARLPAVRRP